MKNKELKIKNSKGQIITVPKNLQSIIEDHIKNDRHDEVTKIFEKGGHVDRMSKAIKQYKKGGFIIPPKKYSYGTEDVGVGGSTSGNGVGGYASMAAGAISAIPTDRDDENINPRNKNIEGIYGAAEAIPYVGDFVKLGRALNQKFENAASQETNQTNKDILNYQAGSVDPLSEWSKNAALYDEGAISTEQWMGNTAMHSLSPGLASTQMDNQYAQWKDQMGKKAANTSAAYRVGMNTPEMQNNQSAYSYTNSPTMRDNQSTYRRGEHGMHVYGDGMEEFEHGTRMIPNEVPVEYQGGEIVFLRKPNGRFFKYRAPKATKDNQHDQGGIKESLPKGAVIISKKFAKEADQAYAVNDDKRIEGIIQKQDRYNLAQGNPLDGIYSKYGLYVNSKSAKKYLYGTDELDNLLPETTVSDVAGSSGFATGKAINSIPEFEYNPTLATKSSSPGPAMNLYSNPYGYAVNEEGKNYGQMGPPSPSPTGYRTTQNPNDAGNEEGMNWEDGVARDQQKKKRNYDWIEEMAKGFSTNRTNSNDVADKENYDKVDYGSVSPRYLDPWESIQENRRMAARTDYGIKNNSGGYAPGYVNSILANSTAMRAQQAKTMAEYDNANVGIYNQFLPINQAYKMQGMQDEAANKGAAHNIARDAGAQIAENTNAQMRDYNQKQQNAQLYQMYLDLYGKKGK